MLLWLYYFIHVIFTGLFSFSFLFSLRSTWAVSAHLKPLAQGVPAARGRAQLKSGICDTCLRLESKKMKTMQEMRKAEKARGGDDEVTALGGVG